MSLKKLLCILVLISVSSIFLVGCKENTNIDSANIDLEKAKEISELVVKNRFELKNLDDIDNNLDIIKRHVESDLFERKFNITHDLPHGSFYRLPGATSSINIIHSAAEFNETTGYVMVITTFEYAEFDPSGVVYTYYMFVISEVNEEYLVVKFNEYITNLF